MRWCGGWAQRSCMRTRRSSRKAGRMAGMGTRMAELSALVGLMRLVSPALPIGGFAYSRGLEHAVTRGWVHDEASAERWIVGLLQCSLCNLDGPLLVRIERALAA